MYSFLGSAPTRDARLSVLFRSKAKNPLVKFLSSNVCNPLLVDLTKFDLSESNDAETVTETITNSLSKHSHSLFSPGSNVNRKRKHGVYVRLPDDDKVAPS